MPPLKRMRKVVPSSPTVDELCSPNREIISNIEQGPRVFSANKRKSEQTNYTPKQKPRQCSTTEQGPDVFSADKRQSEQTKYTPKQKPRKCSTIEQGPDVFSADKRQSKQSKYTPKQKPRKCSTIEQGPDVFSADILKSSVTPRRSRDSHRSLSNLSPFSNSNLNNSKDGLDTTASPSTLKRLKMKTSPSLLQYVSSDLVEDPLNSNACQTPSNVKVRLVSTSSSKSTAVFEKSVRRNSSSPKTSTRKKPIKRRLEQDQTELSDTSLVSLAVSYDADMFNYETVASSSTDEIHCAPSTLTRGHTTPIVKHVTKSTVNTNTEVCKKRKRLDKCTHSENRDHSGSDHGTSLPHHETEDKRPVTESNRVNISSFYGRGRGTRKQNGQTPVKGQAAESSEYSCDLCGFIAITFTEIIYHKTRLCSMNMSYDNIQVDSDDHEASTSKQAGTAKKCKNKKNTTELKSKSKNSLLENTSPGVNIKSYGTVKPTREKNKETVLRESVSLTDESIDNDQVFDTVEHVKHKKRFLSYSRNGQTKQCVQSESEQQTNVAVSSAVAGPSHQGNIDVPTDSHVTDPLTWKAFNDSTDIDSVWGDVEPLKLRKSLSRYSSTPTGKRDDDGRGMLDSSADSLLNNSLDWLEGGKESKRRLKWGNVKKYCKKKSSPPRDNRCSDMQKEPESSLNKNVIESESLDDRKPDVMEETLTEAICQEEESFLSSTMSAVIAKKPEPWQSNHTAVAMSDEKTEIPEETSSTKRRPCKKDAGGGHDRVKKLKKQPVKVLEGSVKKVKGRRKGWRKRENSGRLDPDIFGEEEVQEAGPEGEEERETTPDRCESEGEERVAEVRVSVSSGDSSDEDLPDVFSTSSNTSDFLAKGAVVWVKPSRQPHWPAVICNIYKKKKNRIEKVSVIFLEHGKLLSKSGITVKPGKVLPFNLFGDHEKYAAFKEKGVQMGGLNFEETVSQVESYLWHQAQGKDLQPFSYFKGGLDIEDLSDHEVSEHCVSLSAEQTETPTPVMDQHSSPNCASPEQESPEVFQRNMEPQVLRRIFRNQALVDFIKTDQVKAHLLEVYHGKEASALHTLYQKEDKTREERLTLKLTGFGPVVDEMQQEEISSTLMEFVKSTELPYYEQAPYVFSVWIPEAVVFAIQKLRRQTKARAWTTYYQPPKLSKKEMRQCTADLMNSKSTIDPEDQYRYKLSRERRMQTAGYTDSLLDL